MDKITITAKTYDEAVTKALIELGTTQDNLDIKIIENGTNGLFGIFGAKPCIIEASVIQRVDDFELLKRENKLHSEQLLHSLGSKPAPEKAKEERTFSKESHRGFKNEKKAKFNEKAVEKTGAAEALATQSPKRENAVQEEKQERREDRVVDSAFAEDEDRSMTIIPLTEEEAGAISRIAEDFVTNLLKTMNFNVQITSSFDYDTNEIFMLMSSEEDMGIIIGKRGQTLDSIQYITSLVVNKSTSQYIRVKLDAQGYRGKRKDKLEILANSVAMKVKRFKKPISLEPMNPYERRIIHSALQNHPYITTKSEGEEPNRFITIMPKNNFSRNRFNKNPKFRKSQDRSYRGSREYREDQE